MSDSIFSDQKSFMQHGKQTAGEYNEQQMMLYEMLIDEEASEFFSACNNNEPLENQIKEAIDCIVVLAGWLHSTGINPGTAWNLVHINNMMKVDGNITKNADGKINKSRRSINKKIELLEKIRMLVYTDE